MLSYYSHSLQYIFCKFIKVDIHLNDLYRNKYLSCFRILIMLKYFHSFFNEFIERKSQKKLYMAVEIFHMEQNYLKNKEIFEFTSMLLFLFKSMNFNICHQAWIEITAVIRLENTLNFFNSENIPIF